MSKERVLLNILCAKEGKKHTIARVTATERGAVLRVVNQSYAALDETAARKFRLDADGKRDRLLVDDPFYGSVPLTVACAQCSTEHHLIPVNLKQIIDDAGSNFSGIPIMAIPAKHARRRNKRTL